MDEVAVEVVSVPQETANDEQAFLVEWLVQDGEWVDHQQALCTLEFSKAVVEVAAPRGGYLFRLRGAGHDVTVGSSIAVISSSQERPSEGAVTSPAPAVEHRAEGTGTPTRKARELMDQHGLKPEQFPGISVIRERHVQTVLDRRGGEEPAIASTRIELSPRQRRVAKVVAESAATIPHSYLGLPIDGAVLDERLMSLRSHTGTMVSLTDLLVYAVSRTAVDFPSMNAHFDNDGVRLYGPVNVGLTMNLANGDLLVPVIEGADKLDITNIAARARALQKKALRNMLAVQDLTGGTVTVTSLIGAGVSQVWPIILPKQSAIMAIGDPMPWRDGTLYFPTIAFDHRVLNGSQAAACLRAIVEAMVDGG